MKSLSPQDIRIHRMQKFLEKDPRKEVQSARLRLMGYTLLAVVLLLAWGRWYHHMTETPPGSDIDAFLAPKTITVYHGHNVPSQETIEKLAKAYQGGGEE